MANNLGGKITIDISDLQAKIIQANKAIKSNESAWRESASQMDDWTKSEDALKERLEVINTKIKNQREIVTMLSEKKKLLIAQYGEESKQVEKVNSDIIKYSKAIETSQKENDTIRKTLEKLTVKQDDEKTAVNNATKAVKENTSATDKNAKEQKDLATTVTKVSDGFSILKGVVVNLTSTLITNTVGAVKKVASSLMALPESTRALRKELSQVETAFASAGFSTQTARDAWVNYTAVLGDIDSNATSTLALLSSMATETRELNTWTNVLTGVYAKLGKSYPTAELVKNIKETSNTSKMTENLKKVLQSAGVNTDEFTKALNSLNTEQERNTFILETLNSKYGDLGLALQSTNKNITDAEKAEKRLSLAWTGLGSVMEPVKTKIVNAVASVVDAFGGLVDGSGSVEILNYNIGYLVGTIARAFKDIYSMFEPTLKALKNNIVKWFDDNKDDIKNKIADWLKSIFGEDTIEKAKEWTSRILTPIKTFFAQLSNGDYMGALGTALPVITIGVGLSLLQGTLQAIPTTILSGLTSGFKAKGLALGTMAGLAGVISLGLELKETLEGKQSWKDFGANVVAGILAGLAFAGLTGSISGGVIVASLILQTDVGKNVAQIVGDAITESGGEGSVGSAVVDKVKKEKQKEEINKELSATESVKRVTAEEIEIKQKTSNKVPITIEWTGTEEARKNLVKEINHLLKTTLSQTGEIGSVADLSNILINASEGGKALAKAIAEGYGIGLDDLSKVSELQASQILTTMKEVLGIHSPSVEAEGMAINFVKGWEDGIAGLANITVKVMDEGLTETDSIIEEKIGYWKKLWQSVGNTFKSGLQVIVKGAEGVRDLLSNVLSNSDYEAGAEGVADTLHNSVIDALKNIGGWGQLIGTIWEQLRSAMASDENATKYLEQLVDNIIEGFMIILEDLPKIAKLAFKFIVNLGEALIEATPEIIAMIPDIVVEICSAFTNMLPDFIQIGWDMIEGIGKGLWEGVKGIWKTIKNVGSAIVNGFKSLFGIKSPSRVFRDQIGKNIATGIATGIIDNVPLINASLDDVNTKLNLKMTGEKASGGSETKIVNVYQNNNYSKAYSNYELYKSERAIKQLVGAY